MSSTRIILILFILSFVVPTSMTCQGSNAYQRSYYVSKSDTLPYRILLPENFDLSKAYPLILFLHGSGERGNDNELQLTHGADLFLNETIRKQYPAIVVFPQCPKEQSWTNRKYVPTDDGYAILYPKSIGYNPQQNMLNGLIAHLKANYKLDSDRLYAGGLSLGGMATFELVLRNPDLFAAAFTICGGANPKIAPAIDKTSWWIFHGEADDVVPVTDSRNIYDALVALNGDVKLTIYPEVAHDSWTNAFAEPQLLPWLFSKRK